MFLLNEIIEKVEPGTSSSEYVGDFFFQNYLEDFDNPFRKGDFVYIDDYDLVDLFRFFQIMIIDAQYKNFVDDSNLYKIYKPIFDYINCVGTIKKIITNKIQLNKGTKPLKKFIFEIEFPNGKIIKINNLKFLKLYYCKN